MNFWALGSIFLLAMVKFMFAPFSGPIMGLNFMETYISAVSGAIFCAAIFYFSSSFFIHRSIEKRMRRAHELEARGLPVPVKKNFTRTNRFIVRIKHALGIYGISFWAPFFLSVPIGSIITAKFYNKRRRTFPLIVIGICINGAVTTTIAYTLYG